MKNYFLFKNGSLSLMKASKVDFVIFSFFLDFLLIFENKNTEKVLKYGKLFFGQNWFPRLGQGPQS